MEYIYKFSNFTDRKIDSLSKREVWFSDLEKFNDPFEGEYKLESEFKNVANLISAFRGVLISYNQFENLVKFENKIKDHVNNEWTQEEIDAFINVLDSEMTEHIEAAKKVSASCFIQKRNDLEPLTNNLMWSHYADGLRGFCLKFDHERLRRDFSLMNDGVYLASSDVKYSTEVPTVNSVKYFSEYFIEEFPGINLAAKVFMFNLLSSKSDDWSYENEIRFFSGRVGALSYSPDALVELIIGEKMDEPQQQKLISLMLEFFPKTKISQARKVSASYVVEIVDYSPRTK